MYQNIDWIARASARESWREQFVKDLDTSTPLQCFSLRHGLLHSELISKKDSFETGHEAGVQLCISQL